MKEEGILLCLMLSHLIISVLFCFAAEMML